MSESERDLSPAASSAGDEALIESTEVENANATQMPADEDMGDDDLFGDNDDEGGSPPKKRRLDDEELDSGDDLDREDRMIEDNEPATPEETREIFEGQVQIHRHATLKGSDGEVYLFQNATNNGIEPKAFNPATFEIPTTDHHGQAALSGFSPAQTAATTLRWRYSPNDPSKMQSNSRIIRWSDGSLTLQIGSNATEQYELAAKAFAPPQRHPKKPTPVSKPLKKGLVQSINKSQEAHIYVASIDESCTMARMTNHVTAHLNVRGTKTNMANDAEVRKVMEQMTVLAAERDSVAGEGMGYANEVEDPELLRKRAEKAEKEKAKMEKTMQARREREEAKRRGVMGRSAGLGRSGGMGLTISGLEGDSGERGYGFAKKRGPPKPRAKRDVDSDEEDGYGGGGGGNEYDEEDDFIAPEDDDEDPEVGSGDDEDDAEGEEEDEEEPTPKKAAPQAAEAPARRKGRQVVEDDDDEE